MQSCLALVFVLAALIAAIYAADTCECSVGLYLKESSDSKCVGEVKKFEFPVFSEACTPIFSDLNDSIQVVSCGETGVSITVFNDTACTEKLVTESLPAGICYGVDVKDYKLALQANCAST